MINAVYRSILLQTVLLLHCGKSSALRKSLDGEAWGDIQISRGKKVAANSQAEQPQQSGLHGCVRTLLNQDPR